MSRVIQIVVLGLTLVMSFIAGSLQEAAFFEVDSYTTAVLHGKPLPAALTFAIENQRAAPFLCLLPWIAFLGATLLGGPRDRPGSGDFVTGFILWGLWNSSSQVSLRWCGRYLW